MSLPRKMTLPEQSDYRGSYPVMVVADILVTGEIDHAYNCLAWTLGNTTVFLQPVEWTLTGLDDLYAMSGFVQDTYGPIAVFGTSPSLVLHAAISGKGHGPRWESKDGGELRYQHYITDFDGSGYGIVQAHYRHSRIHFDPEVIKALKKHLGKGKDMDPYLTKEQQAALEDQIQLVPNEVRANYAAAFAAWKATWFSGHFRHSSNPATRRIGQEYSDLIALGPAIIPLVVASLAQPDNFMALQLYDAIQINAQLRVQYGFKDERILEGEQGRARRVVQAWFTNR